MAIGAAGDALGPHRVGVLAGNQLRHHDPLVARLVREPGRAGDIADGIEPVDAGPAIFVDHHVGPVDLDPERFEPEVLDIADDPHRRDHGVEIAGRDLAAGLDMRRHLALAAVELLDHRLFEDRHPLFDEGLLGEGGNLGVLHRQHPVEHFHDRHIRAQRVEKAREFDPDRARADDQKLLRHPRRVERVLVVPDQIAVRLQPRQLARPRAGGEDDVLGRQLLAALLGLDRDLAFARQRGGAHHHVDLVLLEQVPDPAGELLGHPARAFHHRVEIVADLLRRQPEFLGPLHQVEHFCRAQQRLGRDATPVEADAAQMLAFDHRGLQPQLRGPDSGHVAPGARAHHDHIIGCPGHARLPWEK